MERSRGAVVGAFVVGGVLLFAAGLFMIGDRRMLFADHFEVSTTFGTVTGLIVGTPVRLAGLEAGEVLEITVPTRPSEPFMVRMRVREDLHSLVRTDSVCAIQTDGIVGNAFIQINPGTDEAAIVQPGGVLPGRDPIQFSDLIQEGRETFQTVSREIVGLTDDVSDTLTALTSTVQTTEGVIAQVGDDVEVVVAATGQAAEDVQRTVGDVRALVEGVRGGEGTIGQLFTDRALYERMTGVGQEAEQTARVVRETAELTRAAVEDFVSAEGTGPRLAGSIRSTLTGIEEVTSDLAEGTEALKRNFLFSGFFRDRGFFDLDSISREAYQAGLLERDQRTAVRVWLDASLLFEADADGAETLSEDGRRRIDAAMAQLVRYPLNSPLVIEGYAQPSTEEHDYLLSLDRAQIVRAYVLDRFRRDSTLTDVMPLGSDAQGSPSGDGRWAGVALAMFVANEALAGGGTYR